jgi:hypothetical protein
MLVVAPAGDLVTRNLILLRAASRWGESTGLWVANPSMAKTLTTGEQVNTQHTHSVTIVLLCNLTVPLLGWSALEINVFFVWK